VGVPPTLILGVVFIKLFLFLVYDRSVVFFNKFCRTKFPEVPDFDEEYDFGLPLLLAYEGAFSLEATLLPWRLFDPFEYSRFDIYLMFVFFFACSIYC
jgi:hypothetical protein